jgi:hypothetical protein
MHVTKSQQIFEGERLANVPAPIALEWLERMVVIRTVEEASTATSTGVLRGHLSKRPMRLVLTAIVHKDHFPVGGHLAHNRHDPFMECRNVFLLVVSGDDDRDRPLGEHLG